MVCVAEVKETMLANHDNLRDGLLKVAEEHRYVDGQWLRWCMDLYNSMGELEWRMNDLIPELETEQESSEEEQ